MATWTSWTLDRELHRRLRYRAASLRGRADEASRQRGDLLVVGKLEDASGLDRGREASDLPAKEADRTGARVVVRYEDGRGRPGR